MTGFESVLQQLQRVTSDARAAGKAAVAVDLLRLKAQLSDLSPGQQAQLVRELNRVDRALRGDVAQRIRAIRRQQPTSSTFGPESNRLNGIVAGVRRRGGLAAFTKRCAADERRRGPERRRGRGRA